MAKTPLRWMGGKHFLAKWIISHFPPHICYVEPFGGGASVLLQKQPSKVEVYNDINGLVVNFFRVLAQKPWELWARLVWMPYARQVYDSYKKTFKDGAWPADEVERAAVWFYLQRSGFSGMPLAGWGHSKKRNQAQGMRNTLIGLIDVANRLQNVQLENKDFREIITTCDGPDTLFYCDPPFFETRPGYYTCGFSLDDHEDLAKLLNNVKGRACVSYSPNSKVDELYQGWSRAERVVSLCAGLHAGRKPRRVELLLFNWTF